MNKQQTQVEAAKALWSSVMAQAIFDLTKPKGDNEDKARFQNSARKWFNDLENTEVNSFLGICDNIGVDPDKTRKTVFNLPCKVIQK